MTNYYPNWDSIRSHTLPEWYDDCKLGIFIHWGLYAVPAWAEVTWELGSQPSFTEWMTHNPYAEWYQNTIRIENSLARKHHADTYGEDFPYEKFADRFLCEKWEPAGWAKLFREARAGYVVLTTKHHDGFCLYPSVYTGYNSVRQGPGRDLLGELTDAVRAEGLKMGAYYSGLYDWTTFPHPLDGRGLHEGYDHTYAFADYSYNQIMELIDRYKPSVLWNDIGWPQKGQGDLPEIFAHYYNHVPEGVTNDRWSGLWQDYTTAEYNTGNRTLDKKWEMCRGLGLSFGYNQNEDDRTVMSGRALIKMLAEYTANNGNLLINIGPRADGTIPEIQASRLRILGGWLKEHGEAIYGTRPWMERQGDKLNGGAEGFYTRKGRDLYAIIDGLPVGADSITLPVCGEPLSVSVNDDLPVHIRMENYF